MGRTAAGTTGRVSVCGVLIHPEWYRTLKELSRVETERQPLNSKGRKSKVYSPATLVREALEAEYTKRTEVTASFEQIRETHRRPGQPPWYGVMKNFMEKHFNLPSEEQMRAEGAKAKGDLDPYEHVVVRLRRPDMVKFQAMAAAAGIALDVFAAGVLKDAAGSMLGRQLLVKK